MVVRSTSGANIGSVGDLGQDGKMTPVELGLFEANSLSWKK